MDVFKLEGRWLTRPSVDPVSADMEARSTPIFELVNLAKKLVDEYDLTSDAVQSVSLGGLAAAGAHILIVKVTSGGEVKVRITTTDGATQAIPVNSFLVLICTTNPITALDLTRTTGVEAIVKVFMGQASA